MASDRTKSHQYHLALLKYKAGVKAAYTLEFHQRVSRFAYNKRLDTILHDKQAYNFLSLVSVNFQRFLITLIIKEHSPTSKEEFNYLESYLKKEKNALERASQRELDSMVHHISFADAIENIQLDIPDQQPAMDVPDFLPINELQEAIKLNAFALRHLLHPPVSNFYDYQFKRKIIIELLNNLLNSTVEALNVDTLNNVLMLFKNLEDHKDFLDTYNVFYDRHEIMPLIHRMKYCWISNRDMVQIINIICKEFSNFEINPTDLKIDLHPVATRYFKFVQNKSLPSIESLLS